jgi:hypothetical protein
MSCSTAVFGCTDLSTSSTEDQREMRRPGLGGLAGAPSPRMITPSGQGNKIALLHSNELAGRISSTALRSTVSFLGLALGHEHSCIFFLIKEAFIKT